MTRRVGHRPVSFAHVVSSRAALPLRGLAPLASTADAAGPIRVEPARALRLVLRAAERLLLSGDAHAVATRNAWHAVCEDRERAAARQAAWQLLDDAAGAASPTAELPRPRSA